MSRSQMSKFQMAFEYRTSIQMVLPFIDVYDIILLYCDLNTGPVFKWSYHLKSGHQKVRFSDESGIQVFGIQMVTVFGSQLYSTYLR